ncbi:MAG: CRISPR-associated protein [Bacteroidaceae bacterium]|nr:CRISPR-associated protein [Bacteroidaceae bacterium]
MIKPKLFINLTNHPSAMWGEQQLLAARQYGKVEDMPFPEVDEKGDEAYISAIAEEYASRILRCNATHEVTVHLMGELTFTFALLKRLQHYGIPCVASTSQRLVTEDADGNKTEVLFRFERFRRYD